MEGPLLIKSGEFASGVVGFCLRIQKEKHEYVISKQLMRAGTSVGANIREAQYGGGRAEFINKLRIALRECNESELWFKTLSDNGFSVDEALMQQCLEIKWMLIASIKTASGNS